MTPPIKVGLLGAPGAGKSKVAKAITRRLNAGSKTWTVVDGYVEKLGAHTGRTFGEVFNREGFPLNTQVIAERWNLEDAATAKGTNTITCGTIYESIIYAAAQSIPIARLGDEQLILEETFISRTMMDAFTLLAAIRFDYHLLLYLPLDNETHTWADVVDGKLSEVLEAESLFALALEGTHKQRVDRGTQIIKEFQAAFADNEQRRISAGDTASEGQESEPESLPDMPAATAGASSGDSGMDQ